MVFAGLAYSGLPWLKLCNLRCPMVPLSGLVCSLTLRVLALDNVISRAWLLLAFSPDCSQFAKIHCIPPCNCHFAKTGLAAVGLSPMGSFH